MTAAPTAPSTPGPFTPWPVTPLGIIVDKLRDWSRGAGSGAAALEQKMLSGHVEDG